MFWANLTAGILALFGQTVALLSSRYVWRAAAATIGVALFFGLAQVSWNLVVNQFGVAAGSALAAMADGEAVMAVQTFRCLLPTSTATALTLLMTVFLQAVILLWTRRIIFLKIAN